MKAYKESKANEPNESPEESKPKKKKGSVKEFFGKKEDKKKSSPRKSGGGESQKFKSAEFVDTDESSSEEEEKVSYDLFPSFFVFIVVVVFVCVYSQLSLRRTPLGPALSVRLREMSVL